MTTTILSRAEMKSESVFERRESGVRSYANSFPTKFVKAKGAILTDEKGERYIDFLAGCSSLNYGHNPDRLKQKLMEFLMADGLTHSLDMETNAKEDFLKAFETHILTPRDMDYVVQFPGPTGANAVEAAIKIARKATKRTNVIAFTNGFHGCTLGALSLTGNKHHRGGAGLPLNNVTRMPYEGYYGEGADTIDQIDTILSDPSGGIDAPAAFIVETVQGEGGLNAASFPWLRKLEKVARKHGALFIVDDIQAGVGRTGTFFSFENVGVSPDIVTLAKSISGYGLPMALTLVKRNLDIWKPGEHNGTFRGNCHAFVTATEAIKAFWTNDDFQDELIKKSNRLRKGFEAIQNKFGKEHISKIKGRGMMLGVDVGSSKISSAIVKECFQNGLVIETSGPNDEIVKCLAPLTIEDKLLDEGLAILSSAISSVIENNNKKAA